jgi:hypothetical protein
MIVARVDQLHAHSVRRDHRRRLQLVERAVELE